MTFSEKGKENVNRSDRKNFQSIMNFYENKTELLKLGKLLLTVLQVAKMKTEFIKTTFIGHPL